MRVVGGGHFYCRISRDILFFSLSRALESTLLLFVDVVEGLRHSRLVASKI